jgi:hypothetical protein
MYRDYFVAAVATPVGQPDADDEEQTDAGEGQSAA